MTGPLVFALLTYIGSIVQAADVQYHQQRSTNYEHLYNDIEDTVSVHEHGDASFSTMDFALVARELNQHNLTALSDKFVSRQDSRQCVEAFAQYYDDIEPFGRYARGFI